MKDKARQKTDKILDRMGSKINKVYVNDSDLKRVKKEYDDYMKTVKESTESLYRSYTEEEDRDVKEEKKDAYMHEVRRLTLGSDKYNKLIKKMAEVLAKVNQRALDVSNKSMREIYAINYNQVADECKRVGIKVNG